jgi:hypothetical protein
MCNLHEILGLIAISVLQCPCVGCIQLALVLSALASVLTGFGVQMARC